MYTRYTYILYMYILYTLVYTSVYIYIQDIIQARTHIVYNVCSTLLPYSKSKLRKPLGLFVCFIGGSRLAFFNLPPTTVVPWLLTFYPDKPFLYFFVIAKNIQKALLNHPHHVQDVVSRHRIWSLGRPCLHSWTPVSPLLCQNSLSEHDALASFHFQA